MESCSIHPNGRTTAWCLNALEIKERRTHQKPTNAFLTNPNCPWNPSGPLTERLRLLLDPLAIKSHLHGVTSRRLRNLSVPGQELLRTSRQWSLCCSCAHASMIAATPRWREVSAWNNGHTTGTRLSHERLQCLLMTSARETGLIWKQPLSSQQKGGTLRKRRRPSLCRLH